MADVAALDIVIGANVQQALAGLEHLSTELEHLAKGGTTSIEQINSAIKTLQATAAKTTDTGQLAKIGTAIEKLKGEATKLQSLRVDDPFKKITTGSNQATQSLTDLGRVVQDAPYGFIGIANNINPLVESFGRLKKESGSVGGALKGMVAGLAGPAGIGIAISLVTSLLVVFGDKLFSTSKKTDEAAKATEDFAKSLESARAGAMATGIQLQSFLNIARDTTKPLEQRNEALKEANKLMGEHGEKITLANVGTKAITEQTNLFTEALIQQAVAAKYADRIADLIIAQTESARKYGEAQKKLNKEKKDAIELDKQGAQSSANLSFGIAGNTTEFFNLGTVIGEVVEAATDYKTKTKDLQQLHIDMAASTDKATAALGHIGTKTTETTKKTKEAVDKTAKALENMRRELELMRNARFPDLAPAPPIDIKIGHDFSSDALKELRAQAEIFSKVHAIELPVNFKFMSKEEIDKWLKGATETINDKFENTMKIAGELQNVFSGVFTSLASGGQNMVQSLVQSLEQLIIKLAAAAAAAVILNIATGGSAGSFMTIFGKLAGLKLAEGGIVTGPTRALIGEAGPEVVFPLDRLREFIQPNAASVVVLETQVRGNDLYLIQSRTQQRRNRTY